MESNFFASFAEGKARLHAGRSPGDVAVVGTLAPAFSEHVRWHFCNFAGGATFPGTGACKCGRGCRHGRRGQPRQRAGASVLGLGFRHHHAQDDLLRDVPAQALLFWFLPSITSVGILTVVAFIILLCYGGGFGTMPAFAADYFGAKNVGPIYGLMLTAWGFASAFGPLLIAYMRQANGTYHGALHIISGVMLVSAVLPMLVSPPQGTATPAEPRLGARIGARATH